MVPQSWLHIALKTVLQLGQPRLVVMLPHRALRLPVQDARRHGRVELQLFSMVVWPGPAWPGGDDL